MPPKKRKSPANKQKKDAKRSKASANEDLTATAVQKIYQACVLQDDNEQRQTALLEAVSSGALRETVWPALVALKNKQDVSTTEFTKTSYLVAVLVSFEQRDGLAIHQALDFVHADDSKKEHDVDAWNACCASICGSARTDYEYLSVVSHFLGAAWAVAQAVQPLQSAVLAQVSHPAIWHWMNPRRRELELRKCQAWDEAFGATAKPPSQPAIVTIVHHVLLLLEGDTLKLGRKNKNAAEDSDAEEEEEDAEERNHLKEWIFLHRAFELIIDLLSAVQSREYLQPYLDSSHLAVRARLALGTSVYSVADENMYLAQQLLERIHRLLQQPQLPKNVDDSNRTTTTALASTTAVEMRRIYHRRAAVLQKMCHKHYSEQLLDVIYAGQGVLCSDSGNFVRRAMGSLEDDALAELLHKMRLIDKNVGGPENYNREFLMAVLLDYLVLPQDPLSALQSQPLYPTERVLWDFSRIPPSNSSLLTVSHVLSLPKLHTHFLSFADYLGRNFELFRLESAYEIRTDIVDVVRRLRPLLRQAQDVDDNENEITVLQTEFRGWARMALELYSELKITKVTKPRLGERYPSQVVAEITIDLSPCGAAIRREWDELGEYDNMFLVTVDASRMNGKPAPLLSEYHLNHGSHLRWDTDRDRRIPDDDDRTFPERFGVTLVRGCMILQVRDEEGNVISEPGSTAGAVGTKRTFRVALDPAQYAADARSDEGTDIYQSFNLVVRRHGRENNFKAVLETIRGLMAGTGSINRVIPPWLQPILLGQGDPGEASYKSETVKAYARKTAGVANPDAFLDFSDTFLDEEHLRKSFGEVNAEVDGQTEIDEKAIGGARRNYRVRMIERDGKPRVEATSYLFPDGINGNPVRFTPVQVEAIRSGLSSGLTVVVGPPGTGKTDVAVQIIASLYHSFPTQRTIVITHSNAALNDIFQKVMARGDVDERYLLRLGSGERELQTDSTHDFTKAGRVAFSLERRGELLEEVQLLSESLGLSGKAERGADGAPAYTCETAEYFREQQVRKRIRMFERQTKNDGSTSDDSEVTLLFPFASYFKLQGKTITLLQARECYSRLDKIFDELAEYRPLELLRSRRQRADYLIMKQARVVAMTCTHAAIARSRLIELGFEYDNVVVEEAGQMMEIEAFVPLLLQRGDVDDSSSGQSRLKRVCLMGDHNQLPPVIKNMSFAKYSSLDQSLFSRLIRLGVPYIQLDKQGRARPEIASLYSWRYSNLGNLDHVLQRSEFCLANPGFAHTFQVINVENFQGKGETAPTAYFYQNVGEAEYAIALFQYMVLIGYPPEKISILTTYNGQKELILDILSQRCGEGTPLAGVRPRAVSTVDQYQGQQNDCVLLSLVRTESVGHLRDIRRLVVAVSRARLGLYVFCRQALFAGSHELKRTFDQFADRPNKLQLVMGENAPTERRVSDVIPSETLFEIDDVSHLGSVVHQMQETWVQSQQS